MLTISLITMIFYFHPSTTSAAIYFRTVPIMPVGTAGRVAEVNVGFTAAVKQGDILFRLDSSKQDAVLETAKRKIAEVDASLISARADVVKADAQVGEAKASLQQAKDELDVKSELQRRNPGIVPQRDIEKLQVMVDQRQSGVDAANAVRESSVLRVSTLLPAERASAEAALAEAQVEVDRTIIRAGVDGRVEQFLLRPGDVVNQLLRPAGVLIPEDAGRNRLQAGFGQIEAQVMRPGMIAEATCISRPWVIIPLVVTSVQDFIAAGQFRTSELLIDPQNLQKPGSILAFLEPLYKNGLDGVTPGSTCIVNAYTSNHDVISDPKTGSLKGFALHAVDATGLVHALLLRIQALLLPIKTLVLSGH
jgi:multidrug resistance efflux pump